MLLFELIQVAIGNCKKLSHNPTEGEWGELYSEAIKQSVAGVAFEGVQKLPKEQWPPQTRLFEWIGTCEQLKAQNRVVNQRSVEITKLFADEGFLSCILKGQGNALMYPNPFSRMSGDIDIWVDGTRARINEFVRKMFTDAFEQEHHIEFPVFGDIPVEVHYMPCTLLSPKTNRRFHEWSERQKDILMSNEVDLPDGAGRICIPTTEFNLVFQMAHIMIHFFIEGIGLRHFIDYYYVLRTNTNRTDITNHFKEFGLLRFARGVMWIEKECLGLENEYLIAEPDEKRGRVILKEMLEGGNFGHHDERYKSRKRGYLARGITDSYRLLKLATVFPSESMWKLYRKVENQQWKLK